MALPSAASVVSTGLAAYPAIYYDRVALETLRSNLFLYPACDLKQMPDKSGVAMQIFDYTALVANTVPATEGTPNNQGVALNQNIRTLTLSNYIDYVSFSNKVVLTAISDTVAEGAAELAYRGALTVDTVISTMLDSVANGDASTRIDINDGSYMSASKSRQAAMSLRSVNVKPKANGSFYGILPSVMAFDLINDASSGGFIDLFKYTDANKANLELSASNRIGIVGGVEWFESNALPTEAAWQSSAHAAYHAYVIGKNGVIASSLGKTQLAQKNFAVKVSKFDQPIAVDPANQIAAAASYNFFFGCCQRTGATNGFRRIRSESSIG
jgi:N4-gp56 family major capsid protein